MTTRDVPRLLVLADERIVRANLFLQKQRGVIESLRAEGRDTTDASALLFDAERLQAEFIAERNQLRQELERMSWMTR
jgi:hypothetical protein